MIQLKAGDVFLDLYTEDPIKLTISIEDIVTTDNTTAFSRQFRVPATKNNTQFFKSAFEVNGFDFDVTTKKSSSILFDGQLYKTGEIRLQKVFIDEESNAVDYQLIFIGDVRDFASDIGEKLLCELDFPEFEHTRNYTNVVDSWDAYAGLQTDYNNGLFSGSVLYPLVDFGNTYDDNNNAEQPLIAAGGNAGTFTHSTNDALNVDRLRPAIRVKDVIDKIFDGTNFTYTSGFLESNMFRKLYVGAWGDEAVINMETFTTAQTTQDYFLNTIGASTFRLTEVLQGVENDWNLVPASYLIYTFPTTATYDFEIQVNGYIRFDVGSIGGYRDIKVDLEDADGVVATTTQRVNSTYDAFDQFYGITFVTDTFSIPLTATKAYQAGDELLVKINVLGSSGTTYQDEQPVIQAGSTAKIGTEVGTDVGQGLSCTYKQIDFLKDIIKKFRLVIAPDKNNASNLVIEPWQNYIGGGEVFDWTEKLNYAKDVVIEPLFYAQKNTIKFTDKTGEDYYNQRAERDFGETFGTFERQDRSEIIKGERKIETKLEPLVLSNIPFSEFGVNNGMDRTYLAELHDNEPVVDANGNATVLRNPIKPGTRIFFYNGKNETGFNPNNNDTWYLTDGTTTAGFDYYPMISPYESAATFVGSNALRLTWGMQEDFSRLGEFNTGRGRTVIDAYWSRYLNLIYGRYSKRLTAYFILDSTDLLNLAFDDVIFVKNAYYYVDKIYDVQIGKLDSVKVDLIKLQDYYPATGNFIGPSEFWEDVTPLWENITDNFEDV